MEDELMIVGTFAIALITLLGIILSDRKTRESNLLIKTELDARLRPWLRINDISITHALLSDGGTIPWEHYTKNASNTRQLQEIRMQILLENVGTLPTERIYIKFLRGATIFTKKDIWSNGETIHKTYPLLPSEKLPMKYTMTAEEYFQLDNNPHFYGIHVGYTITKHETSTIGKIWKIRKSSISTKDYWIDEPNS